MIEYVNVSKAYQSTKIIDDLSLKIPDGEFVVLIGPSGCGKSTLIKLLNRLIHPSAGTIYLNETLLEKIPLTTLRRKIGYVIQSIGLFPHWTVAKNIATVPRLLGWSQPDIDKRVDELMAQLELYPTEQYRNKYPHELSGGQAQRVGVARALASNPDILLMDEPFGALDPVTRDSLQTTVRNIQQTTGKTVIFVTHDMDEALRLADRIAIVKDGKIEQFATPVEMLINPSSEFVKKFIGQSDLGLKLLSQRYVKQYIKAAVLDVSHANHHWIVDANQKPTQLVGGKLNAQKRLESTAINDEWCASPELSMKEALSRMVWYRVSVLPVVNAQGQLIGEIAMNSMMEPPQ